MKPLGRRRSGRNSLINGAKLPVEDAPAADAKICSKQAGAFVDGHPDDPRFRAGAPADVPILLVDGGCNVSQIGDPIIVRVAIDVVNLVLRPRPRRQEPSKPMCPVFVAVYRDNDISANCVLDGTGNLPLTESPATNAVSKYSCAWVVIKQFANALCGKIKSSHVDLLIDLVRAALARQRLCGSSILALQQ